MLIILFPCITKKPAYASRKKHPLLLIFKENNYFLRMKFFSDPLIKFLWKDLFINKREDILINHLRRIRSHEDIGEMKYDRFVKDLAMNEVKHQMTLLPDIVNGTTDVSPFTE